MSENIKIEKDNELLQVANKKKIHISFSEFALFNQCSHRHLLEKHLAIIQQPSSIHLYFGNAIHESIENTLKKDWRIEETVGFFRTTFSKDMLDNMKGTFEFKNEFENFLSQGEQIIRILDLDGIFKDYELISIEEAIYENIYRNYYFKGFIDLVVRHKITGRYKIVDWKTSGTSWSLPKKMKDNIFLAQMRFYKFFWGKKNNISMSEIDCRYIVLNRFKVKKELKTIPGEIQIVDVESTNEEIKASLEKLAITVKMIHIDRKFPKIKHITNSTNSCFFCPLKGGRHPLCNNSKVQYKSILRDYKKKP